MGKLVPRVQHHSKDPVPDLPVLSQYVQIILLLLPACRCLILMAMSFGTAGTGGFGIVELQLRRLYIPSAVDLYHIS